MSIIVTHSFTKQRFLSTHDMLGDVLSARDNGPVLGHLLASGGHRQIYNIMTNDGEHYEEK